MTAQHIASARAAATMHPPADAFRVFDWEHHDGLSTREFVGRTREAAGFLVTVEGVQRSNDTCRRWLTIEAPNRGELLDPEIARQLTAAINAAADEIDALR
ncbi:hypothetical protein MPRF_39000 [Mycolicibacterium parafortuitum]|uniref:Uncharacterized protein n=1 Tax=Mycolicibacterium parafortuitum TaxID=39692 RepID=A0A7I7U7P7_MYCPF|nr:hypothetical protein [Mycolicibacterium parafortuitum]BBY77001.1 hypothetical protein MPRF_39000 [Mycolicibacterium parafortuitum]